MKSIKIISVMFLAAIFFVSPSSAQNQLDLTFNAVPSKATVDAPYDKGQVVQPDGKVIVWGGYLSADGLAKGYVARLNADGTVDPSFTYCSCQFIRFINALVQPDGKILFAGVNGSGQGKVVRLNSDGSLDSGFDSQIPVAAMTTAAAKVWAVQPDGKVLVEKQTTNAANFRVSAAIYRLNADGSRDTGFTSFSIPGAGNLYSVASGLLLLPDGKIVASAYINSSGGVSGAVIRRSADGTSDPTWTEPVFQPSGLSGHRTDGIALQPDGAVIVTGRFTTVNGVSKPNVARLLQAGNVDLTFTPPATFFSVYQPYVLPGGKILITAIVDIGGEIKKFYRLNSDGSLDSSLAGKMKSGRDLTVDTIDTKEGASQDVEFAPSSTILDVQNRFQVDGAGNIYFFGKSDTASAKFFRLNSAGVEDTSFIPNVAEFGKVYDVARQLDGKLIVVGDFAQMGGMARPRIARVNSDGSLDTSFNPGTGFNTIPRAALVQPDGKILVIGSFATYNGVGVDSLVRLNADGSLDSAYSPTTVAVQSMALQPDGKLVIGGNFSSVNSTARTGVARLNPDGTLDAAFNPIIGSPSIKGVVLSPDGKITFHGSFNGVNGFNRTGMARLNSDGSLDESFTLGSGTSIGIVIRLADGKYLYSNFNGSEASLRRLNVNGSLDGTFTSTRFTASFTEQPTINDIALQPNGKIMVGGNFYRIGDSTIRFNLVRVGVNGGLDTTYVQNDPNGLVRTLLMQPNGKVVVGGDFYAVEGTTRAGIARINTGELSQVPLYDFDGDGKTDISIFRPSDSNWYLMQSQGGFAVQHFGLSTDRVGSADYDGDGKSDIAVYRDGAWWYIGSSNGALGLKNWGAAGDTPLPADFDGDGRSDFIYYRASTGEWFRSSSATGTNSTVQWGIAGDIPVSGDFDGDGKSDPTIFRPSNGTWWYLSSVTGVGTPVQWGQSGDIPVAADFDGDGKSDIAVWRPSNGAWYVFNSSNGSVTIFGWGLAGDRPVPGDFDGDGRADIAVWRPSSGVWYIMQSTAGFTGMQFGLSTDQAVPSSLIQ